MKLLHTHNSPYARRIRVAVRESGLLAQVEEIDVNPIPDNLERIVRSSAAGKVPVLVTDAGVALCETLIIARHLDTVSGGALYATSDPEHETHLAIEGIASALMDSLFVRARENRRDPAERSPGVISMEAERARRLYDALESRAGELGERVPWTPSASAARSATPTAATRTTPGATGAARWRRGSRS
jgi:glutathione S-transferase